MATTTTFAKARTRLPKAGNKIVPHLWFDKEAKEAAEFYTSVFPDSRITNVTVLRDTPSGDAESVAFELSGHPFMAISAGPLFKFNPSVSFFLNFDPSADPKARENLDRTWKKLVEGGKVLMEPGEYPFSKRYGWLEDKYGLSWQLILTNPEGEPRPFIVPSLLFTGDVYGRAEEALKHYADVFKDANLGNMQYYPAGREPDREGSLMFGEARLEGTWIAAMDSSPEHGHKFAFNEAVSLMVMCDGQEEIDHYWEKLSAMPEAEQCGWLKDKFGVSWQVTPREMGRMMSKGSAKQVAAVTQAFLPMKKFDVATIREAYESAGRTATRQPKLKTKKTKPKKKATTKAKRAPRPTKRSVGSKPSKRARSPKKGPVAKRSRTATQGRKR